MQQGQIRDIELAQAGQVKIDWARAYMPLLNALYTRFEREQPFAGRRIAISIHLEAKTAYLAHVLRAGGAEVYCTGCNPLSTQDEIAAALSQAGFPVFAVHGADQTQYQQHLECVLSCEPDLILDDGGDLLHLLSTTHSHLGRRVIGGTEETTTGVLRMRQMDQKGVLPFPMIAVNDAECKHLFDNRYGTGQSTMDALMRNTNLVVAGKQFVVAGYGWCSRGIAMRAKGLGARVIVTEINPVRALEAMLDGFEVMRMDEAAPQGDVFITATGCKDVIVKRHLDKMKDGVLLCNAGHFDVEINKDDLCALASRVYERRPNVTAYELPGGRTLHLLAQGRLVNIAAGDGHPVEIMDMSFAVQALSLAYLAKEGKNLRAQVYAVPEAIDRQVAHMKVKATGMGIDTLTQEQAAYLGRKA